MAKSKEEIQKWLNTIPDGSKIFIADTHHDGGLSLIAIGSLRDEEYGCQRRNIVIGIANDNGGEQSFW